MKAEHESVLEEMHASHYALKTDQRPLSSPEQERDTTTPLGPEIISPASNDVSRLNLDVSKCGTPNMSR
jgi:hypothetical protein